MVTAILGVVRPVATGWRPAQAGQPLDSRHQTESVSLVSVSWSERPAGAGRSVFWRVYRLIRLL
jgi:hypothetical protein